MTKKKSKSQYDKEIEIIADYVVNKKINSKEAYKTARYCLMDSMGCAILATNFKACTQILGPIVPGATLKNGARVPGTSYELDPVQGAFNIGTLIRWVDFNDAFLASEWGHPSDNLGGILALTDYLNRSGKNITVRDVLTYMIKAHEIQGVMSLKNGFNRCGFDHVVLVKLATASVASYILGGTFEDVCATQSQVWIDGPNLRTYRHAPNVGSRKSWAAGDATSRGVWHALMRQRGEQGYSSPLTAKKWGFYTINFDDKKFKFERPLGSYVMENVLFKASFPAEFHAQTAVEAAIQLHPLIKDLKDIKKIMVRTQESAMRIINKTGKLHNFADRDHCLQYMIAIGLLFGELTAQDYEDERAKDSRIDLLRDKMVVKEDKKFTRDYLNPKKRSIANAIQIIFKDGSKSKEIIVEYPSGHPRRRKEGFPQIVDKFRKNVATSFSDEKTDQLCDLFANENKLDNMSISDFMQLWVKK